MKTWAPRIAGVTGTLLACAAAGWGLGLLVKAPIAGLLFSVVLVLAVLVFVDSLRGARLMAWLRADAEGEPPREVGVWGEVARQIERALRRRERQTQLEEQRLSQFLAAVEASPIGVLLLDASDQITWCSRVAADHLGLDPKRDLAQHITNLVRAPAFVEYMVAPTAAQATSFAAAGGQRLSVMVQPYGDGLKLLLTQDITERERTELMRRNFVANVSHEIRTPLTVLAGFVETMSQLPLSEVERKRVLSLMAAQAQRMQTLVADLLTLAQLEGSPRPPADQWLDVQELMQRVRTDAIVLSAGRHQIEVDAGEAALIAGSEPELYSALHNLVVNAIRYTASGGRIDIAWAWIDDGWGALVVRDNGVGIEREHLPRLTERFYRVDSSRSRDTGGTGLGLSIVKHVAQRHGGEIDIQSEPGKGSTFRMLLPPSRVRHRAPSVAPTAGIESTT